MDDLKYWIWFSRIEKLSPKTKINLLEQYKTPQNLFYKTKEQLLNEKVKRIVVEEIIKENYKLNLEKYIKYLKENKIELITIYDDNYPVLLKEIYDPPICLYIKGNKDILNERGISIVGCRECTNYGKFISKKFAYELALNNINVISGLAKGIDAFSHIGCLEAKGKTIAVVRMWARYGLPKRK